MTEDRRPYTIVSVGGIYRLNWEDCGVQITADKVRESSRTAPTAEIRITAYPEGHITWTTLNLMNTKARADVVKFCEERASSAFRDWPAIMEELALAVIERHRQGEPVVELGEVKPSLEPHYRLAPLMLEGENTLIYGEGGIGKSYIAALAGVLVDKNLTFGRLEPMKGNVLYLDYETGKNVTARRVNALQNGFGLSERSNILYRFCWQPVANDISELQRIVAENDIELVIVDSAGPACGGEPEAASSAIQYFTALRSLHVTTLTIAHKSEGAGIGPFGSVYWVNYPRNTFELRRAQDEGSNIIHVSLAHRKANEGQLLKSTSYRFEFLEGQVRVGSESIEDVPDFFDSLPLADKIAHTLRSQGASSAKELAEEVDAKLRSVQVTLSNDKRFYNNRDAHTWELRDGSEST